MHKVSKIIMGLSLALGIAAAPAVATPLSPGDPHGGAYLGVMVDKVSPETAAALHLTSGGAVITNVDQDGPACHAGLKGGDIVTAFNGKPVSDPDQFASLIHGSAPGSTVTMTVVRNGKSQDMKATLGDWRQMAESPVPPPVTHSLSPVGNPAPPTPAPVPPPRAYYPEYDIGGSTPISARHGIVVEPLSTQLCDFFGVPANKGVLVRSVEKGSPGAAAGLKAGDVIVRVNNETIHDIADWKRALKASGGKVTLAIMREKHEQTVQMTVPANTSKLELGDGDDFGFDTATMATLNREQIEEIHRQADAAVRTLTPEIKRQMEDLRKQSEQMRKEIAKLTPEMAKNAREMAETMKPTAKELSDMARDMAQQWKEMQPEFQKQMDELKKELEQQKHEWQEIFKESSPKQM